MAERPSALQRYEAERLTKAARIVKANRPQGPDYVMGVFEQRAPDGFARVEDVATHEELVEIAAGYKKIVGLDMETVNARAQVVLPQGA